MRQSLACPLRGPPRVDGHHHLSRSQLPDRFGKTIDVLCLVQDGRGECLTQTASERRYLRISEHDILCSQCPSHVSWSKDAFSDG
jgi:hypothetical protein